MTDKISASQHYKLKEMVRNGPIIASCTNPTLCALARRGLARAETLPGRAWRWRWTATDEGKALMERHP